MDESSKIKKTCEIGFSNDKPSNISSSHDAATPLNTFAQYEISEGAIPIDRTATYIITEIELDTKNGRLTKIYYNKK